MLCSNDNNMTCRSGHRPAVERLYFSDARVGTTFLNRRRPSRWTVSFKSRVVLRYVFSYYYVHRVNKTIYSKQRSKNASVVTLCLLLYKNACAYVFECVYALSLIINTSIYCQRYNVSNCWKVVSSSVQSSITRIK